MPGNYWFHDSWTIYRTGGVWFKTAQDWTTRVVETDALWALWSNSDVIADAAKEPGLDGQTWRYFFLKDTLHQPSDAVMAEIKAAGLGIVSQPMPPDKTWFGGGKSYPNDWSGAGYQTGPSPHPMDATSG